MIEAGTLIDGRYKVLSRIGSGGMADVYLSEDQLLGRQVAVKVLQHRFAEDQEFVERFRREAQSAAGLSHPNVVAIFDRGEWDGTYYIAMEYLPGRSLKAIAREGPLEVGAAVDIVIQILRAARFAHRRGIIHRDIKPHNVILDEEGRAKVTDFGIARAGASDMTLTGSIMGTAQYLSPEQAQGQAVSEASDIYAIGIVLYELLTGAIPFDGETAVSIALKQVSAPPPVPSALNPIVPAELDAVVVRALAKDPRQRFANADEFIAALEQVSHTFGLRSHAVAAAGLGATELTAVTPPATVIAGGYPPDPPTGEMLLADVPLGPELPPEESPRRRRRGLWILAAILILAAAALALVLLLQTHNVMVPPLKGLSESEAAERLKAAQLYSIFEERASATEPVGKVLGSSPAAGAHVARWSTINVLLSSGPGTVSIPGVENQTEGAALHELEKAGLKSTHVVHRASLTVPIGTVIETHPGAGTVVRTSKLVKVIVSSGPAPVSVPEVVGEQLAEARTTIEGDGLKLCHTSHEPSTETPGTVLSQSPSEGQLPRGECVDLTAASAPTTVSVPNVLDEKQAKAVAALGEAELVASTVDEAVTEHNLNGRVLAEAPNVGATVKRGSTVTITVGVYERPATTTTTTPTPEETNTTSNTVPTTGPEEVP